MTKHSNAQSDSGSEQINASWFHDARYGLFIHWGPYALHGRGEQVLFREHLDPRDYEAQACQWNPQHYDARQWAQIAVRGGFRYAVLTTRHHDGYCLWDSQYTNYTSVRQQPKRDFVAEYVDAFREAGLKVGLYYSLADWRIPAYWDGPENDAEGFDAFRTYVHQQVEELCTNYGKIDMLWFDGAWPWNAQQWHSESIASNIRRLQPTCLINNRLDIAHAGTAATPQPDKTTVPGDFGTPEHSITAEQRPWESCNTSTWRLWGYTHGERWRNADQLLDMLVDASVKGGNMLLNVGPTADGQFPEPFVERSNAIGHWLEAHREAITGNEPGEVTEFVTYGRQTRKGNQLYLIIRFWPKQNQVRVAGLAATVRSATLLTNQQPLTFDQSADAVTIKGLPSEPPTNLFPVIRLDCDTPPTPAAWAKDRLWTGDPARMLDWVRTRGQSFDAVT